jgi:hypothetical protein
MIKTLLMHSILLLCIFVSGGCSSDVEVGFQPIIVPVRVSINNHGEVSAGFSGSVNTPLGRFDIGASTSVDSLQNEYTNKVLIVRVDDQVTVYELEEGKEFHVDFDDSNRLYKKVALNYETNGDIVLELESVKNEDTSNEDTSTIYELPTQEPSGYWCNDLSLVKLQVGDHAEVVWPKVNLRSESVVPMDWDENIVSQVDEGTKITVIGGPECAHEGTWWEVQTSDGQTGWMREHTSDGYLIK